MTLKSFTDQNKEQHLSLTEIADRMKPIDDKMLLLPHAFAHTMRHILQYDTTQNSTPSKPTPHSHAGI